MRSMMMQVDEMVGAEDELRDRETHTVLSHLSRPRLKWFYRFSFRKSRLKWESTYVGEMLLVFLFTNLGFSLKNIIIHCVFSIFRACGGQKVDLSWSRLKWEKFC